MAGHSKWANIKHKKAAQDAKRGKAFTRLTKEMSVAARTGGSDTASNPRLRQLIEKARNINMPKENIERAIKRGTGELPGVNYESFMYEGYGPHGIAVLVETLTDNKNRTVADLRRIFSSSGGSLAEGGAVAWMFEKRGVIRIEDSKPIHEDQLLESLIDFDIHTISVDQQEATIICDLKDLEIIKKSLEANYTISSAEVEWIAQNTISLANDAEKKAIEFLEKLEEHDDIQNMYTNLV